MIPAGLWLLAVLAAGLGLWAGQVVHPALLWSSPVFAALLLAGGVSAGRVPLLDREPRGARLGADLEREVIATAAELPEGSARDLFGGLVRLTRHMSGSEAEDGHRELVAEILPVACRGARALARLDEAVALVPAGKGAPDDATAKGHLERQRDRLVQCLLEAQGGLQRLIAVPNGGDGAATELRQLVETIARQAAAGVEAEALLQG